LILFNRVGEKIILTDAGETLYSLAEKNYELETQVEESIRDFQQQKSGKISVVTTETFGAFYLPEIVIDFYRKFPDIYVSVLTLTYGYVIDSISKLSNDLGIINNLVAGNSWRKNNIIVLGLSDHLLIIPKIFFYSLS